MPEKRVKCRKCLYKNGVFRVYNNYGSESSPREYESLERGFFGRGKRLVSYCVVCPKNG